MTQSYVTRAAVTLEPELESRISKRTVKRLNVLQLSCVTLYAMCDRLHLESFKDQCVVESWHAHTLK